MMTRSLVVREGAVAKTIIICADGTGNAFGVQESNIWRLYQALDKSDPRQAQIYIEGVGTSSWKLVRAIDGATGVGVPSNVRKLYRFLCRHWEPDSTIYMFGFSRGAFTIRSLIGLIDKEGLLPKTMPGPDGQDVTLTEYELAGLAAEAQRAYRRKRAPSWTWGRFPTVGIARMVRDVCVWGWRRITGQPRYADVAPETRRQARGDVQIQFVGLFDTVEAFGVPIEELRAAINYVIWPISFPDNILTDKVECMRHALSLDDERTTFHPLRFDVTYEKDKARPDRRIKEVWFAGVHSDVGGGYDDGALSLCTLNWIITEAQDYAKRKVRPAMNLQAEALERFREMADPIGPVHDSRAGVGVLYRYEPRHIVTRGDRFLPPLAHSSVVERMASNANYAPAVLPVEARALMPDGSEQLILDFDRRQLDAEATPKVWPRTEHVALAMDLLGRCDDQSDGTTKKPVELIVRTFDAIWLRRVTYFALLWVLILIVAAPVVKYEGLAPAPVEESLSVLAGSLVRTIGAVLPSYAAPYANEIKRAPGSALALIGIAAALYAINSTLAYRIRECARRVWSVACRREDDGWFYGALRSMARFIRRNALVNGLYDLTVRRVFPGVLSLALLVGALVVASRTLFSIKNGMGYVCEGSQLPALRSAGDAPGHIGLFTTDNPCWKSGVYLQSGERYRVWIEIREPWFDETIMTDVGGFSPELLSVMTLGRPLRRKFGDDWFQPIARIGVKGDAEWALAPSNNVRVRKLGDGPFDLSRYERPKGFVIPTTPENPPPERPVGADGRISWAERAAVATRAWSQINPQRLLVSDFVASASGELFLFVNDVIIGCGRFPCRGVNTHFYENNTGSADIFIQRLAPADHGAPPMAPPRSEIGQKSEPTGKTSPP